MIWVYALLASTPPILIFCWWRAFFSKEEDERANCLGKEAPDEELQRRKLQALALSLLLQKQRQAAGRNGYRDGGL